MILYKYRTKSEYTDRIFTDNKVWLAKSIALNDPCECSLHSLASEWVAEKVGQMKRAQMEGFLVVLAQSPKHVRAEYKARLRRAKSFEGKYRAFRKFHEEVFNARLSEPEKIFSQLDDQLKGVGIFSLSELSDHPLMWSHYAGNHEGVCFGFEVVEGMAISDRSRFIRVQYSDRIPKMDGGFTHQLTLSLDEDGRPTTEGRIPLTDETIRAAISTKAVCWDYEREWRYVEPIAGSYPFPGPLVEIVFGVRCPEEERDRYIKLASEHLVNDVRIFEMRRVKDSFTFERVFRGVSTSKLPPAAYSQPNMVRDRETDLDEEYAHIQRQLDSLQFAQALPEIEKALQHASKSCKLWRTKGVILGQMLRHGEALRCFERVVELEPQFFSNWYQIGVACTEMKRYEDAVRAYEQAHELNPTDASTLYNLGCVLAHLGRTPEAKKNLLAAEKAGHARAFEMLSDLQITARSEPREI